MLTMRVGDTFTIPGIGNAVVRQLCHGRLGSAIHRLHVSPDRTFYLKEAAGEAAADLREEAARLRWLTGRLPVPAVRWLEDGADGRFRLIIDAVPGRPSHQSRTADRKVVEILAEALRAVHDVPIESCPFTGTLNRELAEAERRLATGRLNLAAFAKATGGRSPQQVLDELKAKRGLVRENVVTHGDYCLPNVIVRQGRLSGMIDWGNAGVADRHRDFMAVAESIAFNLGEAWQQPFFDAYGWRAPDEELMRYYTLLDEFFANDNG